MAEQQSMPEMTTTSLSSNEEQASRKGTDSRKEPSNEEQASRKTADPRKGPPPFIRPQAAPRRPTTEEMIDYYGRKGLDKQAAAEKVIDDLQKALTIAIGRYPKQGQEMEKPARSISGTLDSLSNRLSTMEAKVAAKPDFGGVFVAGVAAGGVLQAVPYVFRAFSQIGRSLKGATSSNP